MFSSTPRASALKSLLTCLAVCALAQAHARQPDALVALINAYRAAPPVCQGVRRAPLAPLATHPVLERVQVGTGAFLDQVLARAGYPVTQAKVLYLSGPEDTGAVMAAIEASYCSTLLSTQFSAVAARRSGDNWMIILAQPAPPSPVSLLPAWRETGAAMLAAVNAARASGRTCGARAFPAAPQLAWNGALGEAALMHSRDMAAQRYFSHQSKDGRMVGERARQAGYRWRTIAENIAVGQESPAEAVAVWLDSPGHCANIMNDSFTEMGAAYGVNITGDEPRAYWTQVFGKPG